MVMMPPDCCTTAQRPAFVPRITGKERDAETGLDYFIFRNYSGAEGRFASPDPENFGTYASNPQSWNGYSYVHNSPLNYIDPFGLADCYVDGISMDCGIAETWLRNGAGIITTLPRLAWDDKNKNFKMAKIGANNNFTYISISNEPEARVFVVQGPMVIKRPSTYTAMDEKLTGPANSLSLEFSAGAGAMIRNFDRLKEVGLIGVDKYYHCMGNCQAANCGPGGVAAAHLMSFIKSNVLSRYFFEQANWENDAEANRLGQQGGNCDALCGPLIPVASPGKPIFPGW